MSSITAGAVREYLAGIPSGRVDPKAPEVFAELQKRGAISGTAEAPQLTPVGEHVLKELSLRAYRVDAWSLDKVSAELSLVLQSLDEVAKTAEYFLAELGPLPPADAVPYVRISAAGLANRRSSPQELAEVFRNTWGMVEVMEGDAKDRLLAAELLVRSPVPVSRLYAAIMHTMETLRRPGGQVRNPVTAATILHLYPTASPEGRLKGWSTWRPMVRSEEVAASMAGATDPGADARFIANRQAVAGIGADPADAERAAAYLTLTVGDPAELLGRVATLGGLLKGRLPSPFLAAALLLVEHRTLTPQEILDWLDKATAIARARRLAPTPVELTAIAVALVHGLPFGAEGLGSPEASSTPEELAESILALVAFHAWIYRPILESAPVPA